MNEFSKFTINEETNKFMELSTIEMSKETKESLLNVEIHDVLNKMEAEKTLSIPIFNKLLQRRLPITFQEEFAKTVMLKANCWELIALKKEHNTYCMYIYDTVKSVFKQKLEIVVPAGKIGRR